MNHHDTAPAMPTALCARVAPLLPALDEWAELSALTLAHDADDAPSSDELAVARTHLATCAYCQTQRAAYARLDTALHGAVGSQGIAPLRTADIMGALMAAQPNTLPLEPDSRKMTTTVAPLALAEAPIRESAPSVTPSPAPVAPEHNGRVSSARWRRAPAWLATVAAALVVALLAAGLARSMGARVGGVHTGTGRPITTTSPYTGDLFDGQGPALTHITMVSPTEGWAVGPSQPGQTPLMYHLLDNVWTPVNLSGAANTLDISTPTALSFYSPTDGLAFFASFMGSMAGHNISVLRYDGRSWRLISRGALDTATTYCEVSAFQMVSPTEGWGVCSNLTPNNQLLLHYVNQSWSTVALPAGLNTTLDGNHAIIPNTATWLTDLSMPSATQGWAVGYIAGSGAKPNPRVIGFVLRYANGQWTVSLKRYDYEFRTVSALASGNVWVGGDQAKYQGGSGANKYTQIGSTPILLHARGGAVGSTQPVVNQPGYFTVEIWSQTSQPSPNINSLPTPVGAITQIAMGSSTNGWAMGSEVSQSHTTSGDQVTTIRFFLLHYDGVRWQTMTTGLPSPPANRRYIILDVGVSANGDCWAVGQTQQSQGNQTTNSPLIQRYHDGRWNYIYLIILKQTDVRYRALRPL